MLDITLNAREVGRITTALFLMEEDSGDPLIGELCKLREGIIDAWVKQNPEHVDLPWLPDLHPDAQIPDSIYAPDPEDFETAPSKGTWTRVDYEPCGHDYVCSNCGCKSDGPWKYCHDCGALMQEVL